MGIFDFDLNGDGRTSLAEGYLEYRAYEDCTCDTDSDYDELDLDFCDLDCDEDWRLEYYDIDSSVDPDLYESFEEFKEALAEARAANVYDDDFLYESDDLEYNDDFEYDDDLDDEDSLTLTVSVEFTEYDEPEEIDESDYPNRRRYNAACVLADEYIISSDDDYYKDMTAKCRFIIDNADSIIAANYFEYKRGFLYSQAVKENFRVPCTLPDEDEDSEIDFCDIVRKIARTDVPLSLEIWSWCLDKFIPYSRFYKYSCYALTAQVINKIGGFANAEEFRVALVHYMNENKKFCETLMLSYNEPASSTDRLIVAAIKEELHDLAVSIFGMSLANAGDRWKLINNLIENVISSCMNYQELDTIKFFKEHLLPLAKEIPLGMVQDEMDEWEAKIDSYMMSVEKMCSQYRFTHSRNQGECDKWKKETFESEVYTYCGVMLPFSDLPYSYITDDDSIKIGDAVIVPVGIDETETEGKVVSVGQYLPVGAPYPIEKTKRIIGKASKESKE